MPDLQRDLDDLAAAAADLRRAVLAALYPVLRSRWCIVAICIAVGVLAATAPAWAASPRSVRATWMQRVARLAEPAPLTLARLDGIASEIVGSPVQISCDAPGVPSALDGKTLDSDAGGEVFPLPGTDTLGPVIHLTQTGCFDALRANRWHDPLSASYFEFENRRVDAASGAALMVLMHEAMHLLLQKSGVTPNPGYDEGIVECTAIENAWQLVRLLHVRPYDASLLMGGMRYFHLTIGEAKYRTVC